MEEVLIFGKKENHLEYKTRIGVYAVILNNQKDRILTIRTERGGYFLPGGGLEENETHVECLLREMIEETGYEVKVGPYIGQAKKYHMARGKFPILNEAYFYIATLGKKLQEPIEINEVPNWLECKEAISLLFHEHQVWGVKEAFMKLGL